MPSDTTPRLIADGFTERVPVANELFVLFYPDGSVRFEHPCHNPRANLDVTTAPALQIGIGHTLVSREPLHIEPSILCADCGTHGWVRNGEWAQA